MRRPLLATVAFVTLSSCLSGGADRSSEWTVGQAELERAVFGVGFARVSDLFIQDIAVSRIAVDGLAGLKSIDPEIGVRRDRGDVVVLRGPSEIARLAAPGDKDASAWSALTVEAIGALSVSSPLIAEAAPDAVYTAVFTGVTDDLDEYSRYVDPDSARDERATREGYGGIGVVLELDEEKRPRIQDVFEEGPGYVAGIKKGDLIVAIDGVPTEGQSIEVIGDKIRGPRGTIITLTLGGPDGTLRSVTMRRARVIPNVVSTRVEGDFAIVRLRRFNAATADNLEEATRGVLQRIGQRAKGLILDMRGNPGGLLDQAVDVADLFVASGQLISTRGRHPDSFQEYFADVEDIAAGLPMVVLIDGNSASGAEVAAAALQDSGRAVLVGSSSYGKGSVQTVTRLPNDGELFLTWSRLYAPAGYTLHKQGVMPTICTSAGEADADAVLRDFRQDLLPVPSRMMSDRLRAPDDSTALARLRAACPWQEHDEELDVLVAINLIEDRELYAYALSTAELGTLAQNLP